MITKKKPLVGILQGDREKSYLWKDLGTTNNFWQNDSLGVSDLTIPSTNLYDGTPSGARFFNIKYLNNIIYCDIKINHYF